MTAKIVGIVIAIISIAICSSLIYFLEAKKETLTIRFFQSLFGIIIFISVLAILFLLNLPNPCDSGEPPFFNSEPWWC